MNAVQSIVSSSRASRALFWLGAAVLAAGVVVLVIKLSGGDDKASVTPQPSSKPTLPEKSNALRNADGVKVNSYNKLDPQVKSAIRTFISTAVARKHLGESWAVIAPELRAGYTYKRWKDAKSLPIVPYPVDDVDRVDYHLVYATKDEILVEVGLSAPPKLKVRPTTFQIGLIPGGKRAKGRWLVNYWMPRWTPPVPLN